MFLVSQKTGAKRLRCQTRPAKNQRVSFLSRGAHPPPLRYSRNVARIAIGCDSNHHAAAKSSRQSVAQGANTRTQRVGASDAASCCTKASDPAAPKIRNPYSIGCTKRAGNPTSVHKGSPNNGLPVTDFIVFCASG